MRTFAVLDYVMLCGDVSLTQQGDGEPTVTELFSASITPGDTSPSGEAYDTICDIEVFATNIDHVTAAVADLGGSISVRDSEPPLQTMIIHFGETAIDKVIEHLLTIFETDAMQFEAPTYWFRFDPNPKAEAELVIMDNQADHRSLMIFQNESGARRVKHPLLTRAQWFAFCAALRALRSDEELVFTWVEMDGNCLRATLTEEAAANFVTHLTEIARRFPQP